MAAYRASEQKDRAKALAGVVLVHLALSAIIITGLNVEIVHRAVEQLKTFDIDEEPPPAPPPPPPREQAQRAKEEEGAAGEKPEPTPIVAPKPRIELPVKPPVAAAPVAGSGNATRSGAAQEGIGTGAGGSGTGRGGGGTGDYTGFTPARLIRNLTRRDYRDLAADRLPYGRAVLAVTVDPSGLPTQCRIAQSSGDSYVDAGLCPLITRRLRFRPALDADGRPIPYGLNYVANWSL